MEYMCYHNSCVLREPTTVCFCVLPGKALQNGSDKWRAGNTGTAAAIGRIFHIHAGISAFQEPFTPSLNIVETGHEASLESRHTHVNQFQSSSRNTSLVAGLMVPLQVALP